MTKYSQLEELKNAKSVCIISHIDPDADALSSMVVFRDFIKSHFKINKVDLFAESTILPDTSMQILGKCKFNKVPKGKQCYSTAIMMDSPNTNRIGIYKNLFENAKLKIVIDHHATNNNDGDINIVEECSSTCEIVYNILKEFNFTISKQNQGKLYAGIITDTNNFTVGNVGDITFKIASEFNSNINRELIYKTFLGKNSLKNMQLLSIAIQNISSYNNGRVIISQISKEQGAKYNATFQDFTGIINKLATINNAKLICLIEPKDDQFYVSMRAKKGYDVAKIAKSKGGGGHTGAAAYLSEEDTESIHQFVLEEFKNQLENKKEIKQKLF